MSFFKKITKDFENLMSDEKKPKDQPEAEKQPAVDHSGGGYPSQPQYGAPPGQYGAPQGQYPPQQGQYGAPQQPQYPPQQAQY
ncbi:hypothetical protein V492_08396, partial [Pseudogymnoascus sp. VKM F-4246]